MSASPYPYRPVYELLRGEIVESLYFGALAVSDSQGKLIASYGDPQAITFLRSTAKPLQILPFLEHGGQTAFNLTLREIALICASHSGTDEHVEVVRSIQQKTGGSESELLCGTHPVPDTPTAQAMFERGENPTPNRHNCSGKHSGMLAYARMLKQPVEDYISLEHPIQKDILQTVVRMCALSAPQVALGVDGCSAPNFAIPLHNAALAFARLCDPQTIPPPVSYALLQASQTVIAAMIAHPEMVGGPGRFDTRLMEVTNGRMISKGGAEGYQGIGILPGALAPGSPAIGIALKIADGDPKGRARPAVTLELLRQLNALSDHELQLLAEFGPTLPIHNWRKLLVGLARPCFTLLGVQP